MLVRQLASVGVPVRAQNLKNLEIRVFISCNRKGVTFGHFEAKPDPGHFRIRINASGWCFWLVLLAGASGWCFWLVLLAGASGARWRICLAVKLMPDEIINVMLDERLTQLVSFEKNTSHR